MKKKEKEHLKADPFVHFMQQAYAFLNNHLRPLLLAAGVVVLAAVVLLVVFLFRNLSAGGENRIYAEAFRIHNDGKMSVEQKIAALQQMKFGKGISASGHLFLAALHYEKGDAQKAEAVLATMPGSRVPLINDEKDAFFARLLAVAGKNAEAEAVLKRLLDDKKNVMAKELILMQLADMQIKSKRNGEAAATLKRILSEHGETPSAMEARSLLDSLPAAAARP